MNTTSLDRHLGCLLGLAAGDALGTTLEFTAPGGFQPIDDIIGGGPFGLKPGEWTDDTSMALCLAESLIEKNGFDPADQCERYLAWRDHGHLSSNGRCFDIGGTVAGALRRFKQTGEPDAGSTDPNSAGNGSIMRLAPVPMFYHRAPQQAVDFSGRSSRTTHQAPTCIDACRYMGGILVALLNGAAKEAVLAPGFHPVLGTWPAGELCPEIAAIAAGSFKTKEPPAIRGSGYVVESLEAALWAFHRATCFKDGALLAVNLGRDADTTGAIYGQFAGACDGVEAIPEHWRKLIVRAELIESFVGKLANSQACTATTTLYRPVGPKELELIRQSNWRTFPPRLPEQPIFYPVMNEEYAIQIARDWNVRDSGSGFVTRFEVDSDFLSKYRVQQVGAQVHRELWIPAEELPEFNQHIVGLIEVVHEFIS